MNNQERRQQRLIVGWWLDVPPAELVGEPLEEHLQKIRDTLTSEVLAEEFDNMAPRKSNNLELEQRIYRVKQALSGVSIRAIARAEYVSQEAICSTIKDTFLRLRRAQDRSFDE